MFSKYMRNKHFTLSIKVKVNLVLKCNTFHNINIKDQS